MNLVEKDASMERGKMVAEFQPRRLETEARGVGRAFLVGMPPILTKDTERPHQFLYALTFLLKLL